MFDEVPDAAAVAAIGDSARAENAACARRLAAIAELYERRQIPVEDGKGRELWRIDPWEAVAAEVAAAQGITAAAAGAQLHSAICLHDRLPKVAALFATGAISYRTVRMIVARTFLALEPDILAAIDSELAETLTAWGPLSFAKTEQAGSTSATSTAAPPEPSGPGCIAAQTHPAPRTGGSVPAIPPPASAAQPGLDG